MAGRSVVSRKLESLLGGPNRFRQVQASLRRSAEGRLPVSLYGKRDILTRPAWKSLIKKWNPEQMMLIGDKVEQKLRLEAKGVPVPRTYMVLEAEDDVMRFQRWLREGKVGFALKPSKGHGGNGVLVLGRTGSGMLMASSGVSVEPDIVMDHARKILAGSFCGGEPDKAIVEERMVLSKRLRELLTEGLLDIRVIVYRGFPIMAMTRLPTKRSGGRANIHQGALAAGISISEGRITSATYDRRTVRRHPNTGRDLVGFRFLVWDDVLEASSAASAAMEMGFVGVDLTVDERRGVVVIEVNKRPGLEIQNANGSGLLGRIRYVDRMMRKELKGAADLGPGIRAELARKWDRLEWGRKRPEDLEEE